MTCWRLVCHCLKEHSKDLQRRIYFTNEKAAFPKEINYPSNNLKS